MLTVAAGQSLSTVIELKSIMTGDNIVLAKGECPKLDKFRKFNC